MHSLNALDTHDVLFAWRACQEQNTWAMAIIVNTHGHSYRKRGAFTLVNQKGEQLGVLSGGCIEADIRLMARKSLSLNKVLTKEYDGRDETDAAYQIGCGGVVWVKFIPLCDSNLHLNLIQVLQRLERREPVIYSLDHSSDKVRGYINTDVEESTNKTLLVTECRPKIHLLICGGGKDVVPVCEMAKILGWKVTVWDPRAGYANKEDLPGIDTILKTDYRTLGQYSTEQAVNFTVLMSHNVQLDAQVLSALAYTDVEHIGLLGPKKRYIDVVSACGVKESSIKPTLSGPTGLVLGGDLPSSIALSIIAQFHQLAFT